MIDITLSRLFERYRLQNDLAALAEVFDRVSPDLLRVARHVAGRGVEPEDLVQATFLAAIERAATFDAERPLLPWLLGILVNQSRRAHRRQSKTLAEDSESAIAARPDHENDAESHEIDTAVARALAELPERYREVLVAHLSEGKDPHVIARELGRPQGTVRAQIHRGIRLMRRILPTGFALGGYVGLSSDALELVRARVLADGARHIGLGPEAISHLATRRAMRATRRRTTVVGTAAVLGVVLWLAWPTSDAPVLPQKFAAESATVVPARGLDLAEHSGPVERAPRDVDAPPSSTGAAIAEYGSVVVNVLEADAEDPARGVLVSLFDWATPRWFENVREARTDARGVVRFERVHPGRVGIHVERGPQMREDVSANKETAFSVRRAPGIELEVVVKGDNGAPLAGAVVDVHARRDEPPVSTSAPTDALGRVRIERAPNECFVTARAHGHVTSNMAWSGMRTAQDGPTRFEIELERGGATLQGLVIDERGATIAGARVQVSSATTASAPIWRPDGTPTFESAPLQAETDATGRFQFDGLRSAAVLLSAAAPGRGTSVSRVEPLGGRFSVESVRLGPEATLTGVSRFVDGSPAPNARVEVVVGDQPVLDTHSGLDGSYVLSGLPCGRVLVRARAGQYGPLTTREIVLDCNEPLEWNPTLVSGATIEGRAIEQDGRVMSTWLVLATPEDDAADAQPLASWARAQVPAPVDELVLQNRIPLTGVFVVPCRSTSTHRLELRGRNAWREAPQAYLTGVRPGARDVVMPVAQARGRIQGRFVDERGRPAAMARVIAVAGGSSSELVGVIDSSSSRFDIETLAGTLEILAWTPAGAMHHFGTVDMLKPRNVDLGDRIVREPGEIVVTATEAEPRSLELLGSSGLTFELVPIAVRTWRAKALQPGSYSLRTIAVSGMESKASIEVAPGIVTRFVCSGN